MTGAGAPAATKAVQAAKKSPFVPEGATWVNVYLTVKDVRAAIDFCVKAFGMQEAGAMYVNNEKQVYLKGVQPSERYFAIRNIEKWLNAPLAEIQAHLTNEPVKPKPKKY